MSKPSTNSLKRANPYVSQLDPAPNKTARVAQVGEALKTLNLPGTLDVHLRACDDILNEVKTQRSNLQLLSTDSEALAILARKFRLGEEELSVRILKIFAILCQYHNSGEAEQISFTPFDEPEFHIFIIRLMQRKKNDIVVVDNCFDCLIYFYTAPESQFLKYVTETNQGEIAEIIVDFFKANYARTREKCSLVLINLTARCTLNTRERIHLSAGSTLIQFARFTCLKDSLNAPFAEGICSIIHNLCYDDLHLTDAFLKLDSLNAIKSILRTFEMESEVVFSALSVIADLARRLDSSTISPDLVEMIRRAMKKYLKYTHIVTAGCRALMILTSSTTGKQIFVQLEETLDDGNIVIESLYHGKSYWKLVDLCLTILDNSLSLRSDRYRSKIKSTVGLKATLQDAIAKHQQQNLNIYYRGRKILQLIYGIEE